ncbi:MAG: cytochrome c maturation protein CcmE [Candidatus Promineifilaceae bacterium]
MAQASWTKQESTEEKESSNSGRLKFIIGGIVLIGAIAFLVFNAMSGNTQLYKTVDEFYADKGRLVGRDLRVAGWVVGDSVEFEQIDATTSILRFDIVDNHDNPGQRLHIVVHNEPRPDLLQDEAQALVEGRADENGEFTAIPGGLMLKCPTRYEEMEQAGVGVPADMPSTSGGA